MLRSGCRKAVEVVLRRHTNVFRHASHSAPAPIHQPNAPLELDPAFQALLRDVEISLRNQVAESSSGPRELEIFPHTPEGELDFLTSAELDIEDGVGGKETRKSPAAAFGGHRIGAVVLPLELQASIERLVEGLDKHALRQDSKRLFSNESSSQVDWNATYDVEYKSRKEAGRHALKDASAFATVALPAHYSAIYAVLDHVKQRLGPDWQVRRVIDWGAATGSGLWASSHAFQQPGDAAGNGPHEMEDSQMSHSTLESYLGVDKREGLVRIGKRLLREIEMGPVNVSWQKSFHEQDIVSREEGASVMALSAFMLSSLPTTVDRKLLVKEMWNSGAEVIILIDHSFEIVAGAREQLLKLAEKDLEDPMTVDSPIRGAHVVAPCPHDGACPLFHSDNGKLECTFSQRLQRPGFVRKTKHSGTGHEDLNYSYVVIRRGPRPPRATTKVGRFGDVGKRELAKLAEDAIPMTSLSLAAETHDYTHPIHDHAPADELDENIFSGPELSAALRHEAYSWPRLVSPPIKRSGHIILDGCTPEGRIMRMTIPKSQGKQPFYDARKSYWGDLFPHEPKNAPQVHQEPTEGKRRSTKHQYIGKGSRGKSHIPTYAQLAKDIKNQKQEEKRARRKAAARAYDEDSME